MVRALARRYGIEIIGTEIVGLTPAKALIDCAESVSYTHLDVYKRQSLSFLGLGAQAPTPEWGLMINTSKTYFMNAWWYSVFPGLAIFVTVLAFNLIGDGLREIMDPRTRNK